MSNYSQMKLCGLRGKDCLPLTLPAFARYVQTTKSRNPEITTLDCFLRASSPSNPADPRNLFDSVVNSRGQNGSIRYNITASNRGGAVTAAGFVNIGSTTLQISLQPGSGTTPEFKVTPLKGGLFGHLAAGLVRSQSADVFRGIDSGMRNAENFCRLLGNPNLGRITQLGTTTSTVKTGPMTTVYGPQGLRI